MFYLKKIFIGFLLPPFGLVIFGLIGIAVLKRRPRLGKALVALTLVSTITLSMPLSAGLLIASLQKYPSISAAKLTNCDVIVVLGGGY